MFTAIAATSRHAAKQAVVRPGPALVTRAMSMDPFNTDALSDLPEDLQMLRNTVRDFCAAELAPIAQSVDKENEFPMVRAVKRSPPLCGPAVPRSAFLHNHGLSAPVSPTHALLVSTPGMHCYTAHVAQAG